PSGTTVLAAEGTVLSSADSGQGAWVSLEVQNTPVSVFSPRRFESLLPGSQVRVTGVWHLPPTAWRTNTGPGVWLDSQESLAVVARPRGAIAQAAPPGGTIRPIASALAAAALLGVLAFAKAAQASAETQKSRSAREMLAEAQAELQRLNQSRERLGRD